MPALRLLALATISGLTVLTPGNALAARPAAVAPAIVIKHGCRSWNPRFRPVLATLGAGQILVALPSYVPTFRQKVYVRADIYQPPLTYHVWIATSNTSHPSKRDIELEVTGDARQSAAMRGPHHVRQNGKTLIVDSASDGQRAIQWSYGGIVYSVIMPARIPLSTEERVAASLTPGVLRKTKIGTSSSARTGPAPCA